MVQKLSEVLANVTAELAYPVLNQKTSTFAWSPAIVDPSSGGRDSDLVTPRAHIQEP